MKNHPDLTTAVQILHQGGIIAYPTEAVYGLGCDPFNPTAVAKLCKIKQRSPSKGFILIAANWQQLEPLLQPIPEQRQDAIFATWPGPITWVFPAKPSVPSWLQIEASTLAVRIPAHPIAHGLCEAFGSPLISTSANIADHPPARDTNEVQILFNKAIDYIISGDIGNLTSPTPIYDAITGQCLRKG